VWSDWNGRTRPVKGISVAVLICAAEHLYQAWGRIRGFWLVRNEVHEPLHSHWIECHRYIADDVLIAWTADPLISAWTTPADAPEH
jgi:hypothetical protein